MVVTEDVLFWFHPAFAIAAYAIMFLNAIHTFGTVGKRDLWRTTVLAWFVLLAGLVSGMVSAQIAWGSYWNWDPKESATLALFLSLSAYIVFLERGYGRRCLRLLAISNCTLIFTTLMISKILESHHSHYV